MISAITAVVVAIGSVFSLAIAATILAVRTGRLIGRVEQLLANNDSEHIRIWASIGRNTDRLERHVERHPGPTAAAGRR